MGVERWRGRGIPATRTGASVPWGRRVFTEESRRQAVEQRKLARRIFLEELLAVAGALIALVIGVRWLL